MSVMSLRTKTTHFNRLSNAVILFVIFSIFMLTDTKVKFLSFVLILGLSMIFLATKNYKSICKDLEKENYDLKEQLKIINQNYSFSTQNVHDDENPVLTSIQIQDFHGLDYGTGMAYSFFYGYLKMLFERNKVDNFYEFVQLYELNQKICFETKKLFILLPKSCEVFSSLQTMEFPNIEESKHLEEIVRDVAGVKKRSYKNSVYKIKKSNSEKIYVVAEYATPLRTFKEVIKQNAKHSNIYEKYRNEIVFQFYKTLEQLLHDNPDCGQFCELIYYNDKYPDNTYKDVGEIILKRINKLKTVNKKKV